MIASIGKMHVIPQPHRYSTGDGQSVPAGYEKPSNFPPPWQMSPTCYELVYTLDVQKEKKHLTL
jgi:hypothetical protein